MEIERRGGGAFGCVTFLSYVAFTIVDCNFLAATGADDDESYMDPGYQTLQEMQDALNSFAASYFE